jgi:hypothetical protein
MLTGKSSYVDKARGFYSEALSNIGMVEGLEAGTPEPQHRHDIIDVRGVGLTS